MEFQEWNAIEPDGYYLRRFSMSEHGGTHLTAPASYFADGRTVDHYPASELVKPAVVIDVPHRCIANQDYALSVEDLVEWESRHGKVPSGSLALLLTGWSDRWPDPENYLGAGRGDSLHFPGFGPEAAAVLLDERGVAGLGTDTAGLEPGIDDTLSVSKLVLSQPRIALENLANLHRLPPTGATIVIGALRLVGGSGSPAAVTAFVPSNEQ